MKTPVFTVKSRNPGPVRAMLCRSTGPKDYLIFIYTHCCHSFIWQIARQEVEGIAILSMVATGCEAGQPSCARTASYMTQQELRSIEIAGL